MMNHFFQRLAGMAIAVAICANIAQAAPHGIYPTLATRNASLSPLFLNSQVVGDAQKTQLLYYGGPVVSNVKTYAVFWGAAVKAPVQKGIGAFLSAIVNSSHMDWLSEYQTGIKAVDGREGTNQTIGRGTHGGEFMINPSHTAKKLMDADIQAELEAQIEAKVLPEPDANTIYMIYFPPGVSITIEGQTSCSAFCAYHEGFVSKTRGNIYYGVMPDLGGACSWGCRTQSSEFDDMTIISSHELLEAITDPFPTPGDQPAYPQAWNTTNGSEIGDVCGGTSTRLTTQGLTYMIQQEFDNASGACAPGPYHSP